MLVNKDCPVHIMFDHHLDLSDHDEDGDGDDEDLDHDD